MLVFPSSLWHMLFPVSSYLSKLYPCSSPSCRYPILQGLSVALGGPEAMLGWGTLTSALMAALHGVTGFLRRGPSPGP